MQPTAMLPKLTDTTQTISFSEGDGVCSAEVYASDVIVTTNAGNHNHGSSKIKLKNLVDYNWEPKFYSGQLLAVHMNGKFLAYSIKAPNVANPGTWSGMIRMVYHPEPGIDRRALIKGMNGEVQDLAFAHIQNQVLLAAIDEYGNFYVYEIEATDNGIRCILVTEEQPEGGCVAGAPHRVVWCPYIPDDDDAPDDDVARQLLTTHGNIARMWTIRTGVREPEPEPEQSPKSEQSPSGGEGEGEGEAGRGRGGPPTGVALGGAWGAEHAAPLVDAAFSPDGTALATAAADGYVMFYQVYMHNESNPRCLHKWQPHGGRPLSCLFFLDNHKNFNTDVQFWKFAVTGADNNTVIKLWSCKTWVCLQTITFTPPLGADSSLGLKAMLDSSASYLVLSDFRARSLYVAHLTRAPDDAAAHCLSIAEFLLPYPVLSFCILDAEEEQVKCESSCDDPFHHNGSAANSPDDFDLQDDEEDNCECGSGGSTGRRKGSRVKVHLYIVQPKGLQEGWLAYGPRPREVPELPELPPEDKLEEQSPSAITSSILQQQSQQLKNLLMRSQTQPGSLIVPRAESPLGPSLTLMTPDAFSSPGKREDDDPPLSATPDVSVPGRTSNGSTMLNEVAAVVAAVAKLTSGGSSPSREVRDIMAHPSLPYYDPRLDAAAAAAQEPLEPAERADSEGSAGSEPAAAGAPLPPEDAPPHDNGLGEGEGESESESAWPQISLAQISEAKQRRSTASVEQLGQLAQPAQLAQLAQPAHPACGRLSPADRARLDAIDRKLDAITEALSAQACELRAIREAGAAATAAAAAAAPQRCDSPRELIDAALRAHDARTAAAVRDALGDGWERISRLGETASRAAATAAGVGAARALEPLAAALQHELAAKLTATDRLLQDNIQRLARSKTVMETLSASIASSLAEMVRGAFREALGDSVLPAVERAHAQLFRQLNAAFQSGTREFAANTEALARAAVERGSAGAVASLRAAMERHAAALAAAAAAAAPPPQPAPPPPQPAVPPAHLLTAPIHDAARSVLEKEMSWWREQLSRHVSRAHSPATPHASHVSHHDRQLQAAQIQSLLGAGDVNGAFQVALSAADLALVVRACRGAEPAAVFGPPPRLRPPVLLSLVQQLAADMHHDTALKHRYLEEAVMSLDPAEPVTREHLPVVVRELRRQVTAFLASHPAHQLARAFRVLLMAADSLLASASASASASAAATA